MSFDRDALRQRLQASFRAEATERLATLADTLANWREGGASEQGIESLFREVHSIKGASRAAGIGEIERICHAWEGLLGAVRHADIELTPARVELCRLSLKLVQRLHAGQAVDSDELAQMIDSLADSTLGQEVELPTIAAPLAERPFHSEVLLQHKLEAQAHARSLQEHALAFDPQRSKRMLASASLKQLRESLDELPNSAQAGLKSVLDYLDWSLAQLDRLHFGAARLARSGGQMALGLAQLSEALTSEIQGVLLLSGSSPGPFQPGRQTR
jgi:two-component system chemotaxis sensor kinase CheA